MQKGIFKVLSIIQVNLSLLILISSFASAETNPPPLESKEQFLKKPLFRNNENYETLKKEQRIADELKKGLRKNTDPSIPLKLAKPESEQNTAISSSSTKAAPPLNPTTDPAFKLSPNPLNMVPSGTKPQECGFNLYLKNYCLYPDAEAQLLICSERWERCLKRYKP